MKDEKTLEEEKSKVMLLSGKGFLQEIKYQEINFALIGKPKVVLTSTNLNDLLEEIKNMLNEFIDIVVDEFLDKFPPIRSINHHIDLIPGANLPNKAAYRMTPRENEEIKNQVQELLDKGIIEEA